MDMRNSGIWLVMLRYQEISIISANVLHNMEKVYCVFKLYQPVAKILDFKGYFCDNFCDITLVTWNKFL